MAIQSRCPSCGKPLPPGAVLCVACGHHLLTGERLRTEIGEASAGGDSGSGQGPINPKNVRKSLIRFGKEYVFWLALQTLGFALATWSFSGMREEATFFAQTAALVGFVVGFAFSICNNLVFACLYAFVFGEGSGIGDCLWWMSLPLSSLLMALLTAALGPLVDEKTKEEKMKEEESPNNVTENTGTDAPDSHH
jgi:hypothetical protein